MSVTFSDYINALKSKARKYLIKLELLDKDENVIDTIVSDLIDGSIDIEKKNGSRRSATLRLQNKDLSFLPDSNSNIWLNTKVRIYTGLEVNGEEYYNSQGIFILGEPEVISNFAEKTAILNLYDKFSMLDGTLGGKLLYDYIINSGTSIYDVVYQVFSDAGEIKLPIIEPTTEVLPYTLVVEAGQTYFDILNKLANVLSWTVYYDKNGYPRFEPESDLENDGSIWDFDEDTLYLGGNKKLDFAKVKNKIRVVGDTIQGETYDAVAEDTDINSPTNTSDIGVRGEYIEDDVIYSTDLAQQRANYELQKRISVYESVNAKAIPIDIIDADSIITITDSSLGLNKTRFSVQSLTLPLKHNTTMDLNVWKIRSFS